MHTHCTTEQTGTTVFKLPVNSFLSPCSSSSLHRRYCSFVAAVAVVAAAAVAAVAGVSEAAVAKAMPSSKVREGSAQPVRMRNSSNVSMPGNCHEKMKMGHAVSGKDIGVGEFWSWCQRGTATVTHI